MLDMDGYTPETAATPVQADERTDAQLARRARDERCGQSMYRLGMMFSTGQGVAYDIVEAHKWFNLAATMGNEEAKRWRKELAGEMSSSEVAEAQRQAREWLRAS